MPVSWQTVTTGTVEPAQRAFASARVAGQVISISVNEGDRVEIGDVLCRLDRREFALRLAAAEARVKAQSAMLRKLQKGARPEEIERLNGALEAAAAAYDDIKSDENRMRRLHSIGLLPDKDLEDFLSRLRSAAAGLVQASAALQLALAGYQEEEILQASAQLEAHLAARDLALEDLRHTTVIAPIQGQISRRTVEPGEWVMPGRMLFEIVDQSSVYVVSYVPEPDASSIRPGLSADVAFAAVPGEVFRGKVERVGPELDLDTRTLPVKIRLDNCDGRLKSGMFGTVRIHHDPVDECITLPREVVRYRGREATVYVVENGRIALRTIKVGHRQNQIVEVIEGLEAGDQVLISEIGGLSPGDMVLPLVRATSDVVSASSEV